MFKESTYRRKRRSSRRSRTPSPKPPSPIRGPDHIMSERVGDKYIPLPPELPRPGEREPSSPSEEEDEEERKEHRRRSRKKDKRAVIHNPEEEFPRVETPSTPSSGRRDSGVFSGHVSPRSLKYYDSKGRLITPAERRITNDDSAVRELTQQFNKIINDERLDKLEAEAKINRLQEKLNKAQADIEASKRASLLNDRERRVEERELTYRDDQKRLSQTSSRESLPKREVVVEQSRDPAAGALAKAKKDWEKRNSGSHYNSDKKW